MRFLLKHTHLPLPAAKRENDLFSDKATLPSDMPNTEAMSLYRSPSARRYKHRLSCSGSAFMTASSRTRCCSVDTCSSGFGAVSSWDSRQQSVTEETTLRLRLAVSRRFSPRLWA